MIACTRRTLLDPITILIRNQSNVPHITDLAGVEIPAGAFCNHPGTGAIPGQNLFLDQGAHTPYTSGTGTPTTPHPDV